ncbi:hypothetical protein ES703_62082 [subsurface metagenome]
MKKPQIKYKTDVLRIGEMGTSERGNPYPHIIPNAKWKYNLWEGIREEAPRYFKEKGIAWHRQKHNLLSSQIMCVNIFFPLKQHLNVIKPWLIRLFRDAENVIDIDFEYIGPEDKNYFNEIGGRGQNRTSSDVSITWLDREKRKNMLLLEFKFTEPSFGQCSKQGNPKPERCFSSRKVVAFPQTECYRVEDKKRRYWEYVLSSNSPFRREVLTTERFCPFRYDFYQLMRNQLLAHRIQSDPEADFNRVEFGVIYHADNDKLLRMSHPFGGERNPLEVWPRLLRNPDTFHAFTVQDLIGTIEVRLPADLIAWRTHLKQRYGL